MSGSQWESGPVDIVADMQALSARIVAENQAPFRPSVIYNPPQSFIDLAKAHGVYEETTEGAFVSGIRILWV